MVRQLLFALVVLSVLPLSAHPRHRVRSRAVIIESMCRPGSPWDEDFSVRPRCWHRSPVWMARSRSLDPSWRPHRTDRPPFQRGHEYLFQGP